MLILTIDDDSDDQEIMREALSVIDPSISCIQMESGIDAIDYLHKAEVLPDYIFLDINMPVMDGYRCLEGIQSIPSIERSETIMYSTTFVPGDHGYFASRGVRYITKQYRFADVVDSIKGVISGEKKLRERKPEPKQDHRPHNEHPGYMLPPRGIWTNRAYDSWLL
jgi:CheY-like chemotaxis protein